MSSIRRKLFWGVCLPALGVALCGLGIVWYHLSGSQPQLEAEIGSVFWTALWVLLIFGGAFALAAALAIDFFITQPIQKLAAVMGRAEEGDFLVRAPVKGDDEISRLSVAFNRMLARITSLRAQEIDTHRDLEAAQAQITLKEKLEATNVQLESRINELSLLYDVARSLNETLELEELFSRVGRLVTERMRIPRFSIMTPDTTGDLVVKVCVPEGSEGLRFHPGEGVCGKAAQELKAVYLPDVSRDSELFVGRGKSRPAGSLLSVPMAHESRLLGVLNFERPEVAAFGPEEIELFTAVAAQAALAVRNARLHEETVTLSITDPLTRLPNRRHLFARLEMEIARAQRYETELSFVMMDIDHFKRLNDAAGHRAGDITLEEVGNLLRPLVRRVDTLARYGGEEFGLVLPKIGKDEALEVAEKLRVAVEQHPFTYANAQAEGRVTISLGVGHFPGDATDLEHLVDCADSALYASKRGGRNAVHGYAPGMELHPGRERGPHAQKKRTGEFPAVLPAEPAEG